MYRVLYNMYIYNIYVHIGQRVLATSHLTLSVVRDARARMCVCDCLLRVCLVLYL